MSKESVTQFLEVAAQDESVRNLFCSVTCPEEFLQVSQQLGYRFTLDEFKAIAHEQSQGVQVRRSTGVWKWLRQIHWV
ncbi:MAG: Nif11-like leader peptide family natural product precursor [Leptolyngbyaceae cyanobacterium]